MKVEQQTQSEFLQVSKKGVTIIFSRLINIGPTFFCMYSCFFVALVVLVVLINYRMFLMDLEFVII